MSLAHQPRPTDSLVPPTQQSTCAGASGPCGDHILHIVTSKSFKKFSIIHAFEIEGSNSSDYLTEVITILRAIPTVLMGAHLTK